jgi:hypothetical protein
MLSDLGSPGTEPASVRRQYAQARGELDSGFDAAQKISKAGIEQEIKQAGYRDVQGATGAVVQQAQRSIARSQGQARSALAFQEASSGLNQTNYLLSNIGKVGGSLASGALAFGGNAMQSGNILSALNQQNSQMASGYGSLIGTVAGGALGLWAGNPYLGASLGGAAGGAVGGWIGGGF